ncbi:protein FD isoform X1 [Prunus persica]|uniref:protein FD isoform X1 n=1 Tax=Prunus persica TaxID=3760 RepID=UPI0009AB9533|nr:protein FD isoform X1 [Prunus persica]
MLSSTSTGRGSSDQTNYNTTSNNSTNTPKRVASSSTNSSWSSSSPSPFSHQPFSLQTPQRTMEEVWKDINLASLSETTPNRRSSLLHHINLPHGTHDPNFRNLQDFLARPFSHNEPPVSLVSTPTEQATLNSPASPPLPPPGPPPVLSLTNSGSDHFQLFYVSDPLIRPPSSEFHPHHRQSNPNNISSSVSNSFSASPFESLAASSSGLPSFGKRAFPDSDHSNSGGDRRHNRMIKNRESAARSRARKQAYTNELELEVAHLMEENTRLKRQQEQQLLNNPKSTIFIDPQQLHFENLRALLFSFSFFLFFQGPLDFEL